MSIIMRGWYGRDSMSDGELTQFLNALVATWKRPSVAEGREPKANVSEANGEVTILDAEQRS